MGAISVFDHTVTNEELIKLGHIILGGLSALGESVPVVKKMIEVSLVINMLVFTHFAYSLS